MLSFLLVVIIKSQSKTISLLLPKDYQDETIILKNISVNAEIVRSQIEANYTLIYHHEKESTICEAKLSLPFDINIGVNDVTISYKNQTMIGVIKEKQQAWLLYEDAKNDNDIALLIHRQGDLLMIHLAGFGPNETVIVKFVTHSPLTVQFDHQNKHYLARYIFSTSIVPKYTLVPLTQHPLSPNPSKLALVVQYYFSFKLTALTGQIISNSGTTVYEYQGYVPYDIVIDIIKETHNSNVIVNVENYGQSTASEIIFPSHLWHCNDKLHQNIKTNRSYVFLIDRSGSMRGPSIEKAKDAMILFVHSLPKDCLFDIMGLGGFSSPLLGKLVEYNETTLVKSSDYVRSVEADMGETNIVGPLHCILSKYHPDHLIILTDGAVINSGHVIDYCSQFQTRISTIGLGDAAANANFLQRLAKIAAGTSEFVYNINDLEGSVIRSLEATLNGFYITSIQSNIGQICKRFPFILPDNEECHIRFYSQSLILTNYHKTSSSK